MTRILETNGEGVSLIRRGEMPELRSVVVHGVEHALGIHKDFRAVEALARFLPESARPALAWVHLEPGEVLATHEHPIETMIVICRGSGRMVGDHEADLEEGDIVAIPRGRKHGFVGGAEGYWALSIQFEGAGLYENPAEARVAFDAASAGYDALIQANEAQMRAYANNEIFALVQGDEVADPAVRAKLLDTIQIWSRQFQRVVMSRVVFQSDPKFGALAKAHLAGEYGHDENLETSRNGAFRPFWDPVLEATAAWFPARMLSLDDAEKTVLVHLVLEGSAQVFHRVAHPIMAEFAETNHFAVHDEEDEDHFAMGLAILRGLDPAVYPRLTRILDEGWSMMNELCARMATLARAAKP